MKDKITDISEINLFKNRFYLFSFGEMGREGEREEEKPLTFPRVGLCPIHRATPVRARKKLFVYSVKEEATK